MARQAYPIFMVTGCRQSPKAFVSSFLSVVYCILYRTKNIINASKIRLAPFRRGLLEALIEFHDPRAVVTLGDDAGEVNENGIEEHIEDDDGRTEEAEDKERDDRDPVRKLGPAGFGEKLLEARFRKIRQVFFTVTVFKRRPTVGQMFFPFTDAEKVLVNVTFMFPFEGSKKTAIIVIMGIFNMERPKSGADLERRPQGEYEDEHEQWAGVK
ncbi:MAG: hypothetical protein NTV44_02940 [Firmicutes bacterium]|nr:hypothetical protein [Bacillota bacterium]